MPKTRSILAFVSKHKSDSNCLLCKVSESDCSDRLDIVFFAVLLCAVLVFTLTLNLIPEHAFKPILSLIYASAVLDFTTYPY